MVWLIRAWLMILVISLMFIWIFISINWISVIFIIIRLFLIRLSWWRAFSLSYSFLFKLINQLIIIFCWLFIIIIFNTVININDFFNNCPAAKRLRLILHLVASWFTLWKPLIFSRALIKKWLHPIWIRISWRKGLWLLDGNILILCFCCFINQNNWILLFFWYVWYHYNDNQYYLYIL